VGIQFRYDTYHPIFCNQGLVTFYVTRPYIYFMGTPVDKVGTDFDMGKNDKPKVGTRFPALGFAIASIWD